MRAALLGVAIVVCLCALLYVLYINNNRLLNILKIIQYRSYLKQFHLPHSRGSSHGHSRITRKAYRQDFYVRMMKEAYELWFQLERETGSEIYNKTGMIAVGKDGGKFLTSVSNAIRNSGEICDVLSPREFREQYSTLSFPDDFGAVYDGVAGILWADKALSGIQKVYVENGGEIRSGEKMLNLIPGKIITVNTTKGRYRTNSIVICAGPWAPQIIKPLGIHVPLKMTPDENFILDTHPHWENIVIGAGFSGHGFKLAPVVGKVLSELTVGKRPSYDLSPFSISRFNPKSNL